MIFLGQDKRLVPNGPKLLSAHRFLVDSQICGWDWKSAGPPIAPKKEAGTRVVLPKIPLFLWVFYGR